MLKKILMRLLARCGYQLHKRPRPTVNESVVSLQPGKAARGGVLLAHFTEAFLQPGEEELFRSHSHFEETRFIAGTFLDLGYEVEVIDYRNRSFRAHRTYQVLVSARTNLEWYASQLNPDCLKIAHLGMAHWLVNNPAVYRRCVELRDRRGIALAADGKLQEVNWAMETADCGVVLGNGFTKSTYDFLRKPLFTINNFSVVEFEAPEQKDLNAVRGTYLWLGSDGLIHKGLDLALEAFAGLPEHRLVVCGAVEKDVRFCRAYAKELYHTENIATCGWVDVGSAQFKSLCQQALGILYPSACEGQAGSVVTCMHAGLIPIISYKSGVDVHDGGVILKDCAVESIRATVRQISSAPTGTLRHMARATWEIARRDHSRAAYRKRYREIMDAVVGQTRPAGPISNMNAPPTRERSSTL